MNMRFILALMLSVMLLSTGCRSPRLFGWRGANCGWQPRGLFRRQQPPPAFQPPGCMPGCGPEMGEVGGMVGPPVEAGMPVEPYGMVTEPGPVVSSGPVLSQAGGPLPSEIVMGPETREIPSPQ